MNAIQVQRTGGPEVLVPAELPVPEPGPHQARVRVAAAGVNYIDTYHRTGLYPLPLPFVPGVEGAGTVEAVGPGVTAVAPGDRVAWVGPPGTYAEQAVVPVDRLVPVPAAVDLDLAAAALLQGMTAHYLTRATFVVGPAHTVLVLAAAGGTGQLVCQLARAAGARVIGAVGSEPKEVVARAAGAEAVVRYDREPLAAAVRRLTDGRGVDVVYDGVGQATFHASLDALAPRGMLVLFGQASGPVAPFDPALLNQKGSVYLTRPSLFHYVARREELLLRAGEVLGAVADGRLRVAVQERFPLAGAAEAHRRLEGRGTRGKLLLAP